MRYERLLTSSARPSFHRKQGRALNSLVNLFDALLELLALTGEQQVIHMGNKHTHKLITRKNKRVRAQEDVPSSGPP